jgi:DNA polymerase (family 10)
LGDLHDEKQLFRKLDLPYIPPELREGHGEIEAARSGRLPELIELSDIKGDLHSHTVASDGRNTLEEMVEAARQRGYEYLAVTDHSASHGFGNNVTADRLLHHIEAIHELDQKLTDFKLLAGSEVNILPDGSLDYSDEVLAQLDWVVASVHSSFRQDADTLTQRIVTAINHPSVDAIGHLTGRMIGRRPPDAIDKSEIFAAAAKAGTMIEINANPNRRDLSETDAQAAAATGVMVVINSDAHSTGSLAVMRYGVATARRGWLTAKQVANTRSWSELQRFRKQTR